MENLIKFILLYFIVLLFNMSGLIVMNLIEIDTFIIILSKLITCLNLNRTLILHIKYYCVISDNLQYVNLTVKHLDQSLKITYIL